MNAANGTLGLRERLEVDRNEDHVIIVGNPPNLESVRLPDELSEANYTANARDNNQIPYDVEAPVSNITIYFNDYRRSLKVEGLPPDEVDATFAALRDKVSPFSLAVGGIGIRVPIMIVVFFGLFVAIAIMVVMCIDNRSLRRRLVWPIVICVVAGMVALVIIPWADILAGFLCIRGDASLAVRYAPQLTFIGVILTIVALVISLLVPVVRSTASKSNQPSVPEYKELDGERAPPSSEKID